MRRGDWVAGGGGGLTRTPPPATGCFPATNWPAAVRLIVREWTVGPDGVRSVEESAARTFLFTPAAAGTAL